MHNTQLKSLVKGKNLEFKKYYLINLNWINEYEKYYNYDIVEKELKNNQIIKNIKPDDKVLFNEKKVLLLIKNLPVDINLNININEKKNEYINDNQREPNIDSYFYENDKYLMFYNKFQLINEEMYDIIFGDIRYSVLNQLKNNCVQCIFYEGIIMIELSQYVTVINSYIIEV